MFFGELGCESYEMVSYFESHGAKHMNRGENPVRVVVLAYYTTVFAAASYPSSQANWMLSVITNEHDETDFVEEFLASPQCAVMKESIQRTIEEDGQDPDKKVVFSTVFAAPLRTRMKLLVQRVRMVYWRSPAYNLLRMLISIVIAFVLGSIFITERLATASIVPENQMSGILSLIFISFIIIGVLSMNSVLPIMMELRDNFYRHRAAGMYGHMSLALALGVAETPFIIISGFLFCVIFMPCVGLGRSVLRSFGYWYVHLAGAPVDTGI